MVNYHSNTHSNNTDAELKTIDKSISHYNLLIDNCARILRRFNSDRFIDADFDKQEKEIIISALRSEMTLYLIEKQKLITKKSNFS